MASIFTKIVRGEIPSYKIAENDHFMAFLDIQPLAAGHTLVIPKMETDYLFDLEDRDLGAMMVFSKKIAKALRTAVPCLRIGVCVIGLEVPHAHIHLIPLNRIGDINFERPKLQPRPEELQTMAENIRRQLA
jgi:histidine triad (HIT) family protein